MRASQAGQMHVVQAMEHLEEKLLCDPKGKSLSPEERSGGKARVTDRGTIKKENMGRRSSDQVSFSKRNFS